MCGITGIYAFNQLGRLNMINLAKATEAISSRGPDNQAQFNNDFVGLGHRRLSIIDTSAEANQPMVDPSGRYVLIFNGEIYNFKDLRKDLEATGVIFRSASDTEVLLHIMIKEGADGLHKLNGFFAFAFYDKEEHELLIVRDRFGIKPLHYYKDQDKVIFASEVKSLMAYGIEKSLDRTSLFTYLQLNYLPAPMSMIKGMNKLLPGHFIRIKGDRVDVTKYYEVDMVARSFSGSFETAVEEFKNLMEESVVQRLVADVPLGTFLSGGVDSTIVSGIASKHIDHLRTFSIGFKDESFFDETDFANKAAEHFSTQHTVFRLTNNDLFEHLYSMLDYLDEPFADSSALAVYILSKKTKQEVSVALSGDGADELFAGYNKHAALLKMMNGGFSGSLVKMLWPVWHIMPKSRNNEVSNRIRQLDKFARAAKLSPADRYWMLAAIGDMTYAKSLLAKSDDMIDLASFNEIRNSYIGGLDNSSAISDNLLIDLNLVLPNDMLTKVDMMSMAHGLEVRVPFLDHQVVEFAFSLPDDSKITPKIRKKIVQEAYRSFLPEGIYNRSKKGFEVPLLKWFRTEMKRLIVNELLSDEFIREQGIFEPGPVKKLIRQLYSRNPGDAPAKIWALIVFQWWYKRTYNV